MPARSFTEGFCVVASPTPQGMSSAMTQKPSAKSLRIHGDKLILQSTRDFFICLDILKRVGKNIFIKQAKKYQRDETLVIMQEV